MPLPADDDWRLTVRFESHAHAQHIFLHLREHAAAALAADRLKDGVVAEHDGEWLRVYATSERGLRRAQQIVASAMRAEGVEAEEQTEHHDGRRWEPVEPSPGAATGIAEHHGEGPWGADAEPDRIEVRFELAHRDDAIAFAKQLTDAGYEAHRRGAFVFLFAEDHDSAHALGEQLRGKAPAGARSSTWAKVQGRSSSRRLECARCC
ncbi:MAG TPA: hypothetical protein VEJ23_01070 [Solirubrobacteraceae bacterium]|nr:hypothetical protein [Solirubrobacteraceae bacterium]